MIIGTGVYAPSAPTDPEDPGSRRPTPFFAGNQRLRATSAHHRIAHAECSGTDVKR